MPVIVGGTVSWGMPSSQLSSFVPYAPTRASTIHWACSGLARSRTPWVSIAWRRLETTHP